MALRSWYLVFGTILVSGLLVGVFPSVGESWSAGVAEGVEARPLVAVDTADTTGVTPDTANGWTYAAGAILYARDDDVALQYRPSATAQPVAIVWATDPLVYLGKTRNGFLWVHFPGGLGWIRAGDVAWASGDF